MVKAIRIHAVGGPEVMALEDVEIGGRLIRAAVQPEGSAECGNAQQAQVAKREAHASLLKAGVGWRESDQRAVLIRRRRSSWVCPATI